MTSKIKVDNIADQDDNNIINESGDVITVGASGDTVAVAGNIVKSNAYQAGDGGNIINQCGTTITLGASGDTVSLASGASQTGFGRTGTVDWQTTKKTANFTATSGEGYFCDTSGGAFTLTLPASPSAGDIVALKDYASSFSSNNLTIGRNSSNLDGSAADKALSTNNISLTLVYVDSTQGWKSVEEGTGFIGETFIEASGGTVTCCGDYKIHTFTGPGTFTVSQTGGGTPTAPNVLEYLVIAGGGAGGTNGGGGGAGGFRFAAPSLSPLTYPGKPRAAPAGLTASAQAYPVTVGAGASAVPYPGSASRGSDSVFSSITSTGGGGGHGDNTAAVNASGGSGGGGAYPIYSGCAGGAGNTPPVSPPQGRNGGSGAPPEAGGGGGGAIDAGSNAPGPKGGNGGIGAGMPTGFGSNGQPCGSFRYYSGGGGGARQSPSPGNRGLGATGGGADAGIQEGTAGSGTANTGGGAGGSAGGSGTSGAGGSGIVVIRYKFQ
jgi:hypothetical protein